MASPTFYKDPTTRTFDEGLQTSDGVEQVFNDSTYYSLGGIAMVESWGGIKTIYEFTTGKMSLGDRDLLISFVNNDLKGRVESFTYTDRDSIAHTVRLVEDKIHYIVDGPNYWIAKLTLEELIT